MLVGSLLTVDAVNSGPAILMCRDDSSYQMRTRSSRLFADKISLHKTPTADQEDDLATSEAIFCTQDRRGEVTMQAKDYPLNVVLQERQQWVIPVYQRTYAWDTRADKQLPNLWDDLRDRASERLDGLKPKPHFVGAIIYSQPTDQPFGTVNRRFLVDGQQRITTFSLVLCALRECARERSVSRIVSTVDEYLFNAKSASMAEPEREQFKLWSSSFDRPLYLSIVTKKLPTKSLKTFRTTSIRTGS